MTLKAAVAQGEKLLNDSGVPAARLTAEVLLAHALRQERVYLISHSGDELGDTARIHFGRYLHERVQGKPTQYVTRRQEFYGRVFYVAPGVLIPRPETELLVETLVTRLQPGQRVLDVGVGSGCICATLALETRAQLFGTDISADALRIAARNVDTLRAPVLLAQGDLVQAFAPASLDAVVSNPPYVPESDRATLAPEVREWEPEGALFAGRDGLDAYRRLVPDAARVLRPGGLLAFEFGFGQSPAIQELLREWDGVEVHSDLAGIPRFALARRAN
ncbi:MAG TPA: peptide chain release factor N(5)-glutamine methyltransferase [Bryobacteraceae bacterium]|nr:peptide chain release factor N(5)-glutamine methyltransferase [Bryobacteraceae bacterium]